MKSCVLNHKKFNEFSETTLKTDATFKKKQLANLTILKSQYGLHTKTQYLRHLRFPEIFEIRTCQSTIEFDVFRVRLQYFPQLSVNCCLCKKK